MKQFTFLFILFISSNYLWANCNTTGNNCLNPKTVNICSAQSFSENFTTVCTDAISSWNGSNGTFNNTTNDIFYEVTIAKDPSASTQPSLIELVISNMTAASVEVFFLGTSCSSNYIERQIFTSATDGCQGNLNFSVPDEGTYYFAIEGTGTLDIRFGGITGTSMAVASPSSGCPLGYWDFEDISNCSAIPFKDANPSFELCLNGSVLTTNSVLTYNLAPATNQLCIRTSFSNSTGGESIKGIDFNFGPALTAVATTPGCTIASPIADYSFLPAQQGGNGSWQVSGLSNTTSSTAYIPANTLVDKKISWLFDSNDRRGDASTCNYTCAVYEFCFEITATNNEPDRTKIVGVFYPDGYNENAFPGGNVNVIYGCTSRNCYCSSTDCFAAAFPNSAPRIMDFEDPAPVVDLPVKLTYFTAKANENSSLLEWTTASEKNNNHFEVEHSINGQDFKSIARVEGHGNSAEVNTYKYVHDTPNSSVNYYRLKQVDFDGTSDYSHIVRVRFSSNNAVTLYPTHSNSIVQLDVNYGKKTQLHEAKIEIFNINGQLMSSNISHEETTVKIDISSFSEGQYFVRVKIGNETTTKRFIKIQ